MTMDFELRDDEIRKIRQVALSKLRKEYHRWACWALGGKFQGWAKDMADMGLAVALSQIDKWDRSKSFTQWVCLKVCEEATADLRKRTRRKNKQSEVDAAEELMTGTSLDGLDDCIRRDSLKGFLKKLSPQMQTVTALYYACGMNDPEIARFLKMKLPTVQSLRHRAKEHARQHYRELYLQKPLQGQAVPAVPREARGQRRPRDSTDDGADSHQWQKKPSTKHGEIR